MFKVYKINFKIKREIDGKINLHFHCIESGFKKFQTVNKKEISDLLNV